MPKNDHDTLIRVEGDVTRAKEDIDDIKVDITKLFQKVATLPLVTKLVFGLSGTMLVAVILAIMGMVLNSGSSPTS